MENSDKGRTGWRDNSQDMRLKDEIKNGRRGGKPQVALYRPGSGPLRKSEEFFPADNGRKIQGQEEGVKCLREEFENVHIKESNHVTQSGLQTGSNKPNVISQDSRSIKATDRDRAENVSQASSTHGSRHNKFRRNSLGNVSATGNSKNSSNDSKKKLKKPEQARYVPKLVAQAIADREIPKLMDAKFHKMPMEEENWDEVPKFQQQQVARDARPQNPIVREQTGAGISNRAEPLGKSKFEASKKSVGVRGNYERNWPSKDVGNGHSTINTSSSMKTHENVSLPQESQSTQFSGNRRNYLPNEGDSRGAELGVRPNSPKRAEAMPQPRELRQASEPRVLPPASLNLEPNRMRDTRSVEPGGNSQHGWSEKVQAKPPSGRRGSGKELMLNPKSNTKHHINLDTLPPRLRKKYMMENGMTEPEPPPLPVKISATEDIWDGSTVTFQGTVPRERENPGFYPPQPQHHAPPHHGHHAPHQHYHHQHAGQPPPYHQMQHHPQHMHHHHHQFNQMPPPQHWANTLPARARGRGRLRPEDLEMERAVAAEVSRFSRSLTPDRVAMPDTRSMPPGYAAQQLRRTPSQESLPRESRMYTPPPQRVDDRRAASRQSDGKETPPPFRENRLQQRRRSSGNSWEGGECSYAERKQEESKVGAKSPVVESQRGFVDLAFDTPSKRLDWGDEVEESERLERERKMNVAVDRSNSHAGRDRKKRRRKRGSDLSGPEDRSLSRDRDHSGDRGYRGNSRERFNRNNSKERNRDPPRRFNDKERNWRESAKPTKEKTVEKSSSSQIAGIIVLPSQTPPETTPISTSVPHYQTQTDAVPYPMYRGGNQHQGNTKQQHPQQQQQQQQQQQHQQQRRLFDPNNPNKPIMVSASGPRSSSQNEPTVPTPSPTPTHPSGFGYNYPSAQCPPGDGPAYVTDQFGNSRPTWYDPYSSSFRAAHNPHLLLDIERADIELHWFLTSTSDGIFRDWNRIVYIRQFLQQCLQTLLVTDIKFCQTENVEQHLWKILFYNIIELLRKRIAEESEDPVTKDKCKQKVLSIIDEGTAFLESLLETLEVQYKFKLETFLSPNHIPTKGLGFAGLALVSAQKIFLFLGDLARYKEQVNETTNFGKSRQFYIKAHQINPKNGRPYNQLAILAVYARRKLDAVYYYMRSLMASNPFLSAKESLVTLFDENRKKYEQSERKRREERESRVEERMKEKEGAGMEAGGNGLRREYWVRPESGRRRLHITSTASLEQNRADSEEEELNGLSSIEVNKRFITSYLNVHGKLFSKVGMESFQEAALQMLREFRALLQHSPVPLNANRILHLLALNMFAIDNTQLKDTQLEPGYRSAVQENALIVSIQMFNLLLERCVSLLREQLQNPVDARPSRLIVNEDMLVLLPAVKIWCDWLLCHGNVWNPPPSCLDYRVGPAGDAWCRLAVLVNLLSKLEQKEPQMLHEGEKEGYEMVRLAEDATLSGFTPLMYNTQEPCYTPSNTDMEVAQVAVRIRKIIFFGAVFLCGVDPPVIKLQKCDGVNEYVSVVQTSRLTSPSTPPEDQLSDSELPVDSYSEDEEEEGTDTCEAGLGEDIGDKSEDIGALLLRKELLEKQQKRAERRRHRAKAIFRAAVVTVEVEVKPHYLVPDTNCFIDYLSQLQKIAQAGSPQPLYTLMVPHVVYKELEGLSRGGKGATTPAVHQRTAEHVAKVAERAKCAVTFLSSRHPGVRCVTSRGTILGTTAFTMEEETDSVERNDDRILATALSLGQTSSKDVHKAGEPRQLYREVVLLTEDRNLRLKALSQDVPVREVPVFVKWAGLE